MGIPHRTPIVHQLPEYAACGHPPSYEYPLPVDPQEPTLASLHPWLRELATLDPSEAHSSLRARWSSLSDDALCQLRDHLLQYAAISIVTTGPRAWLLCVREKGGFNLIAPPVSRESIRLQQGRCGMGDNRLLTDLLEHFGGLREDFAPGGGYFIDEQEWRLVNEPFMEEIPGYSDWKNALFIFSSRGGDGLLLHPSGRVGWWVGDEVRMRNAYDDLGTCLVDFIRYREVPWPFDPYEPRPDYWRVVG
jgi:hypothetical protein